MFRSIRWRIATTFVILILACMGGLSAYLLHFVKGNYLDDLRTQLTCQAQLVGDITQPYLDRSQIEDIDPLAVNMGNSIHARITIIGRDGVVLGDSEKDPRTMDNHRGRPEVATALSSGTGSSIRHSAALDCDMMYVAVPITVDDNFYGVARVALPLVGINQSLGHINRMIIGGIGITALIAILVALQISRSTTQPLKQLSRMSRRIASGELDQRIQLTSRDEVGELAEEFNLMSVKLKESVTLLTRERDRIEAVLSTIGDGILIVDEQNRVTMVNRAAEKLFELPMDKVLGLSFIELARDHELDDILQRCRSTGKQQTGLVETTPEKHSLRVVATPLGSGSLVHIQDLTQLRHLETVRRDFVANISHELRTPIASLKVLAETLQQGAINDKAVAPDFLDRINMETDRLAQMVNELSELSRIESGEVPLKLEPIDLAGVVKRAAERLRTQAERGQLHLEVITPPNLSKALADEEQVEQVVINLLHNAIKFTPPQGSITISIRAEDNFIRLSVADTGCGIPADDLPRIFERFYKADKARAGGGTGLGLAIARHIVDAHHGKIWAESEEGKGSIFTFTLPVVSKS
ncbi:MAG: HAMP domain-containing protein [Dehalococcoidales bacterium]|nr:HAMP domain-containing protein [Dehalococcoidales bacterium]